MTSPLPDHSTHAQHTTTHQRSKDSDHDHRNHHAEHGRRTGDGRTNGDGTSEGDHADSSHDSGDRSDTDRPQRTRQGTAVRRPERTADGSAPSKPDDPTVTLTAGPDGALWVAVDGADVRQVATRINAVCDGLIRAHPSRE